MLALNWHRQFGLSGPVEALDEEQQQLLLESIASDPVWASKGEASCSKPFALRAGRIVLELFDAEVCVCLFAVDKLCQSQPCFGASRAGAPNIAL